MLHPKQQIYTLFAELRQHTNTSELHTIQCRKEETDKQTVSDTCFQTENELCAAYLIKETCQKLSFFAYIMQY